MIDCICIACVWVRRLGLVHTAEQDGTTSSCPTYMCTTAQLTSNATNIHVPCPNATQRFPDQDLRSQCSMGDDACVYYCRCCGELATDEETSWQADKQKQTPLNFVIAAKSWISGSCLRLLLSRFYYCCSLSAGLKKKSN